MSRALAHLVVGERRIHFVNASRSCKRSATKLACNGFITRTVPTTRHTREQDTRTIRGHTPNPRSPTRDRD